MYFGVHSQPQASVNLLSEGIVKADGLDPLSRGALYLILQNRLYRGEISHVAR
jgi:hypothetical protein